MGLEVMPHDARAKSLRAWHLALLRFAVTLDVSDKQAVWAIAAELDRLGSHNRDSASFAFFRRTTLELCAALLEPDDTSNAIVRRHLARMPDDRLKRALQVTLEPARRLDVESDKESVKPIATIKPARRNSNLWRGLAPRRTG
jgi:hypothetical protein